MFILMKGHQPGVYVPLRALFLVAFNMKFIENEIYPAKKVLHKWVFR